MPCTHLQFPECWLPLNLHLKMVSLEYSSHQMGVLRVKSNLEFEADNQQLFKNGRHIPRPSPLNPVSSPAALLIIRSKP